MKKDRIFVIIIGLVLANLAYFFAGTMASIVDEPDVIGHYFWLAADGFAIFGALWLFKTYRKGVKSAKKEARQEEQDS